ncbi:uncharacterized protein LOC122369203 [Amphibalanus amphitrite]|uniref:uncharacterized protein LOC122369203 n=1 Tax=Amphibalanus amphitrite TaxID=1232801 RepID=UPI001C903612|nr:uncharacterized protein LOC122369203 [Amphibalanus amphitrite]
MADLEKAKKRRVAAKAWVSRTKNKLSKVLDDCEQDVDVTRIQTVRSELKSRLEELDSIQLELEVLFESEDDMLEDIIKAGLFRDEVTEAIERADKMVAAAVSDGRQGNVPEAVSSASVSALSPQLPRLDLPSFDGDVLKWIPFWERFGAAVGERELPDVVKFEYLQSCLQGEAARCVAGLSLTSANYQVACDLLSKRFGKPEVIIFNHVQQLLAITGPLSSTSQSLRSLIDNVLIHVRSLSALEVTGDKYGIFLVPMILSKLNPDLRMEWARLGPGKEADLNALMDFLAAEVERRERSGAFTKLLGTTQPARDVRAAGRSQPHKDVRPAGRNQPLRDCVRQARTPSGAALTASSGVCIFCGKAHRSVECHELLKLSVSQRHDLIKQSGACFRCLSESHRARECQSKCSTSCQLLTLGDLHEDAVRNLWSLEGVGIRSDEEPASSKVLEDFESSVSFSDDGSHSVTLVMAKGRVAPVKTIESKVSETPVDEAVLVSAPGPAESPRETAACDSAGGAGGARCVGEALLPSERWGKFSKAVRVVAWVRRFIENCRCPQQRSRRHELSSIELADAKRELLRQEQRSEFHEEWTALETAAVIRM